HTRFSRDWSSDVCSSDLAALADLNAQGVTRRRIRKYLESTSIVPVLTAHPTEVQRKSTLDLHRDIARQLALYDTQLTPSEADRRSEERRVGKECRARWSA